MLKIATWNVNSILPRLALVEAWLQEASPDIVMLQELKCVSEAFPRERMHELGYSAAVHGQKTYNGVAILSKYPLEDVTIALPGNGDDPQARYIEAVTAVNGQVLRLVSVYVPNGQDVTSEKFPYKLSFLDRLARRAEQLLTYDEMLVIGGDYNVAPEFIDVWDPVRLHGAICHHPEERARFRAMLHYGIYDAFRLLHPQTHAYSWWDYRGSGWERNHGMRLDHLLLSPQAADRLILCEIMAEQRGKEKPSDHAPVLCALHL